MLYNAPQYFPSNTQGIFFLEGFWFSFDKKMLADAQRKIYPRQIFLLPPSTKIQGFQAVELAAMLTAKDAN